MKNKETIKFEITEPHYYLDSDVTYAQADAWFGHVTRDLRMDIVYPQTEGQFPCIVWICGGAWTQMSKCAHMPYLTDLARRGFVVASVEYRLGHEAPFPGAVIDIKGAIRYLRANAKRYSINPEKFGVMGESAGGYLAEMIALSSNEEFEIGRYLDYSSAVQAACPWYAPCDLQKMLPHNTFRPMFFNGDTNDKQYGKYINPISYVTPSAPPFLILHGSNDTTVPLEQGELLYETLTAQNIDTRLIILEGEGHAGAQFFQRPLWDIIAEFFKEKLK